MGEIGVGKLTTTGVSNPASGVCVDVKLTCGGVKKRAAEVAPVDANNDCTCEPPVDVESDREDDTAPCCEAVVIGKLCVPANDILAIP